MEGHIIHQKSDIVENPLYSFPFSHAPGDPLIEQDQYEPEATMHKAERLLGDVPAPGFQQGERDCL